MHPIKSNISNRRLFRQYMRWLPYQLGLINKAAYLHQIKEIRKNDVFIVSFPKSGNSWLRNILAYLIRPDLNELGTKDVNDIVPDIYLDKDCIDEMKGNRFIKTHDVYFNEYPQSIYIHRHPADVFISYYHFQCNTGSFEGSFTDFIKLKEHSKSFGSWTNHVSRALKFEEEHPERILIICYEQLKNNYEGELKKIINFCKFNSKTDINLVKEKTSFEALKSLENKKGSLMSTSSGKNFFRSGGTDNKADYYSKELLNEILKENGITALHERLGYGIGYYLNELNLPKNQLT